LYTFRGERGVVIKSTLCTLVIMVKKMDGPLVFTVSFLENDAEKPKCQPPANAVFSTPVKKGHPPL
jgi:hypothetical protein